MLAGTNHRKIPFGIGKTFTIYLLWISFYSKLGATGISCLFKCFQPLGFSSGLSNYSSFERVTNRKTLALLMKSFLKCSRQKHSKWLVVFFFSMKINHFYCQRRTPL